MYPCIPDHLPITDFVVQLLSCVWFLWPHGLQHTRLPRSSLSPAVCPNPCPLSQWCRPTISSSVVPFSPCPQAFSTSGSFPMSRLFASSGQSICLLTIILDFNLWTSLLPHSSKEKNVWNWSIIWELLTCHSLFWCKWSLHFKKT